MSTRYVIITLILITILLSICLLFSRQILMPAGVYVNQTRNTDGTMTFTVRTVTYNGSYHPNNIGAIWITNSSNQFVKTIKVWASERRSNLVKWVQSSSNNTTGAITGATLTSHQLHSVTWNGKNSLNASIPDGSYNVNVEYTESSSTTSNPGKYIVVPFDLGTTSADIVPTSNAFFTDMHLVWTPVPPANGTIAGQVTNTQNQPISGAVITAGTQTATSSSTGNYSLSIVPGTYNVSCSVGSYITQTQNNIVVTSNQTSTVNFSLSPVANQDSYNSVTPVLLNQNYPNPFKTATSINYYLKQPSSVLLNIYNVKGEIVSNLESKTQSAGWHEYVWNGKLKNGSKAVAGKYICKLTTNNVTQTRVITKID